MPGMGQAPPTNDPIVVSAFHTALAHQGLIILALLALLAIAWNAIRTMQFRRSVGDGHVTVADEPRTIGSAPGEPPARRILRTGFGILWLFDGLLQLQSAMPLGMPGNVIQPAGSTSRGWVQGTVNFGISIWERHPVQAAAATVWIQLGIGALLLVASRGRWSRFAAFASIGWGLIVWIFGEAFGGIFAPGLSWLFGAPGSVLLYVVAGILIAIPESAWSDYRLGRKLLVGSGCFFLLMASLQAWPGRGFWQGSSASGNGSLATMLQQMVETSQPQIVKTAVSAFLSFDLSHGWAVNLFVVLALVAIGVLLFTDRPHLLRAGLSGATVLCLADWLLVQDLGIFGGTGTDPNTMPPIILLIVGAYVAYTRPPLPATEVARVAPPAGSGSSPIASPWWARISGRELVRGLAAVGAIAIVLVGAVPMAFASVNSTADPTLSEATDGTPNVVNIPAPGFALVNQSDRPVSLADLKGKVVALTFLDPVCTSDCPVIAQEFRQTDKLLGAQSRKIAFVAIATNQLYRSVSALDAFDRQEGLEHTPNWMFLTGTTKQLASVWSAYGVQEQIEPAGAMVAHSDLAYVIDGNGNERVELNADPTAGSAGTSSFVTVLASELRNVLDQQ
jgi:cytochrome oxidase Cu insertion factor (SCO1/SenC/PrrC family)